MRLLLRSKHFYIELALFAAFWTSTRFLSTSTTLLLTNSLLLATCVAVALAYIPSAWEAIRGKTDPETQHIRLGIAYHWTFGAVWRMWSLLWLTSGQQAWVVNNDIIAFIQAGIVLGGIYHLTSPGALGTDKPSRKALAIGMVLGLATFCAAMLTVFQPDTHWITEAIHPYVPGAE